jgi:carboxyl-terminal processing protease
VGTSTLPFKLPQFLKDGVVVCEQYGNSKRETLSVKTGGLATDIPMVLLVNEFSASAEIMAGALQDYGARHTGRHTNLCRHRPTGGTLIGGPGAVRVTIARWLTQMNA